jgi:hypothetical protein
VRHVTFFRLVSVGGVPRSKLENIFDPFFAFDSATEGAVFDRIGLGFAASTASDLDRIVVALRCREGREACGLGLDEVCLIVC